MSSSDHHSTDGSSVEVSSSNRPQASNPRSLSVTPSMEEPWLLFSLLCVGSSLSTCIRKTLEISFLDFSAGSLSVHCGPTDAPGTNVASTREGGGHMSSMDGRRDCRSSRICARIRVSRLNFCDKDWDVFELLEADGV
jgi:hypothetical protein